MSAGAMTLRTPHPLGAKHLRAAEWADWLEQAIASPAHIQLSKDGARDLVVILRKAAARLATPGEPGHPPLPMSMATLRVPSRKHRPSFTADVPPHVRRLIWLKWLQQQVASERPFLPLSSPACAELAALLQDAEAGR